MWENYLQVMILLGILIVFQPFIFAYVQPLVRVNVDNTFPSSGESEVGLIPSVH